MTVLIHFHIEYLDRISLIPVYFSLKYWFNFNIKHSIVYILAPLFGKMKCEKL